MKKFSIAVCVCAVLFSFSNYGECVREVSAQTSGAEENLAILQDIIRENECQAGMAFLGYTYENADTSEILEYTRQEELAAAYPFLQDGTVVDAGVMKSMLLFQDLIVRSVFIRLRLRKKGNIWKI